MGQKRVELYRDDRKGKSEWRWRRKAANNRTTANSGEGYKNRVDAVSAASQQLQPDEVLVQISPDGMTVKTLVAAAEEGDE